LEPHKFPRKIYGSYIKSAYPFYGNQVPFHKELQRVVTEKFFSAALVETYFNDPAGTFRVAEGQVCQPVMNIKPITATGTATTVAFASSGFTGICATGRTSHNILSIKR
jgi:hypothetical protein